MYGIIHCVIYRLGNLVTHKFTQLPAAKRIVFEQPFEMVQYYWM